MRSSPALRSLLLAAVGSTVLAGAATAQSAPAPPPAAAAPTKLDDIVVTGAPYGLSQRAAVIATDVLDEQTLATAPAAALGDLVSGRPGVRSTDFAPGASRPVIRGLSGPRVQVLTNGIGGALIDSIFKAFDDIEGGATAVKISFGRVIETLLEHLTNVKCG